MVLRLDPTKDRDLLKKLGVEVPKAKGKSHYTTKGFVDTDGFRWASMFEYECWLEIRSLIGDGVIADAQRQVLFPLEVDGEQIAKYTCDFVIVLTNLPNVIWLVDAKSEATHKHRSWSRIVKHVKAQYKKKIYVALQGKVNVKTLCLQMMKDAVC